MTAQASVFYGELANTWSCLKAARAHQIIAPQLLALDLIILRQAMDTLRTTPAGTALSRCPVEVLTLIKDELYPLGLAIVIENWAEEYADWVTNGWELHAAEEETPAQDEVKDDGSQDYSEEFIQGLEEKQSGRKSRCMAAAKLIRSSGDWNLWAERGEFGNDGLTNWNWESYEYHSAGELLNGTSSTEINDFLDNFGLRIIHDGSFRINGKTGTADVSSLYLPISLRLAHPKPIGITIKQEPYESFTSGVINITSIDQQNTLKPFKILFEKYHVEFAPCGGGETNEPSSSDKDKLPTTNKDGREAKMSGKPKEKPYHPKPSWKLQCGLWSEW